MVVVVVSNEYKRVDLKSAPGGYVQIRPLPYGKKLERRDKSTKMSLEAQARGKKGEADVQKFELEQISTWAAGFDFAYCIGEHNLTDQNKNKLDFSDPRVLNHLDPKVGQEIEAALAEINGDEEENLEDFLNPPTSTSEAVGS
jgi:hypothetical protein